MYGLLNGVRVIEGASFIAAPFCALSLAQLGAEVIRFDTVGGGPDFHRWPRDPSGASFYWEGLNRSKKSIAINLADPRGRELAAALVTAPGEGGGIFVTNYPVTGFLSHDRLAARRADLITARIMGHADGGNAVDYTVNSAMGIPMMTGPADHPNIPVNHVLPAWDLLTGSTAATSVLAALISRRATGLGQEIRVPLSDVAAATLGTLGQVAEVLVTGRDRPKIGNDLFGAFGRDFVTGDGRRLMIVAITSRQWSGLVEALNIEAGVATLEAELGVSFAVDEGLRYEHRDRLGALVEHAVSTRSATHLATRLDEAGACWGPYRTLSEAVAIEKPFLPEGGLFTDVDHVSGHTYPTPGYAASFLGLQRHAPVRAPKLGEHTEEVLASVLAMPSHEIATLHDSGIVQSSGAHA
ncbi:CoA transferase [Mesorhizobium abyssinicae]|uniref:CoA transferase n=1 Tax=Mesorhizobium abyssinicae TaxID=1209958 RepID=UPI002A247577|nr:CoA transferase [Mesorhizobium abyssinicae]MDX8437278.1 CoA transferase [Mesorhizobium abyssinicae]